MIESHKWHQHYQRAPMKTSAYRQFEGCGSSRNFAKFTLFVVCLYFILKRTSNLNDLMYLLHCFGSNDSSDCSNSAHFNWIHHVEESCCCLNLSALLSVRYLCLSCYLLQKKKIENRSAHLSNFWSDACTNERIHANWILFEKFECLERFNL